MGGEADPEGEGEGGEAEGSGGGSGGFDAGFGAGEESAVGAASGFALDGVLFGHAEAGGEDAGEGEEEASDDGAVVACDEGGEYGDDASEEKAGEVFGGSAFAEFGDVDADEHEGLLSQRIYFRNRMAQRVKATPNQIGERAPAAVRLRGR